MNREIKFKAKAKYNGNWIAGLLIKRMNVEKLLLNKYIYDYFIFVLDLEIEIEIDPSTICQLITKIGKIEIYEYDCFWDNQRQRIGYFYYDEHGYQYVTFYNITDNIGDIFEDDYKSWSQDLIHELHLKMRISDNLPFIGNWHDGEEYLLNKIKEVA